MWVYIISDTFEGNHVYTVGFYDPDRQWHPDEDFPGDRQGARDRVHYLNGGSCGAYRGEETVRSARVRAGGQ